MMWQRCLLSALAVTVPTARAIVEEYYTTNAVCKQNHCINPVFPGLEKLKALDETRWKKYDVKNAGQHLSFCKTYVDYDFALPIIDYTKAWNNSAHRLEDIVLAQEQEASRLYFYHISAMSLDAWDHAHPELNSDMPMSSCVRQVARMACFTYLPMANPDVKVGGETKYFKPCKSSCENYVKECNVECCDDSVQCVFSRSVKPSAATSHLQISDGYYDRDGPCKACTGGAKGLQHFVRWAGVVGIFVGFLQIF